MKLKYFIASLSVAGTMNCASQEVKDMDDFLKGILTSTNESAEKFLNSGSSFYAHHSPFMAGLGVHSTNYGPTVKVGEKANVSITNYNDSLGTLNGVLVESRNKEEVKVQLFLNYVNEPLNMGIKEKEGFEKKEEGISLKVEDSYGVAEETGAKDLPSGKQTLHGIEVTLE